MIGYFQFQLDLIYNRINIPYLMVILTMRVETARLIACILCKNRPYMAKISLFQSKNLWPVQLWSAKPVFELQTANILLKSPKIQILTQTVNG